MSQLQNILYYLHFARVNGILILREYISLSFSKSDIAFVKGGTGMLYSAIEVAKYVISYCTKKNRPVSNLKLQKMLYYTWIDYYKKTQNALFLDDICAWQLGPVVPDVYYEYCSYAGTPIIEEYDINLLAEDQVLINSIIENYLYVSASSLVSRSHKKGGAWDRVYQDGLGNRDVIPFALIQEVEGAD